MKMELKLVKFCRINKTKYLDLLKYGAEVVGEPFDINMTENEANLTFP